jgi:hypothetical protein
MVTKPACGIPAAPMAAAVAVRILYVLYLTNLLTIKY